MLFDTVAQEQEAMTATRPETVRAGSPFASPRGTGVTMMQAFVSAKAARTMASRFAITPLAGS